jgi:hypothetical protein
MMAAGSLLEALYFSGSRLSTGEPNETGVLWCYLPETTSPAQLYTDSHLTAIATQPITLDNGGRIPFDDFPNGLWVTQPVRLLVQDSGGATVSDTTFAPATADNVSVGNAGFTGTTIDDVLDAAFASTEGVDFKYLESGGATARLIHDKFQEQGISVKDFGAVGNGIAIDTTAVQSAMNEAKALSTNVIFPAGTYKIDQALTLTTPSGVGIIGAGQSASVIHFTNSSANGFTVTNPTSFSMSRIGMSHTSTSSGTGIAISGGGSGVRLTDVNLSAGGFLIGASVTGAGTILVLDNCFIGGQSASASARGLVSSWQYTWVRGGNFGSTLGYSIELQSGISDSVIDGVLFQHAFGTGGVLFNANVTGTRFAIYGCPGLGTMTTPIDLSGLATDPGVRQWGNGVDGLTYSAAVGNTLTIKWTDGPNAQLTASSGGAGVMTVAAPTPTPSYRQMYTIRFRNSSGGNVTWSLNPIFKLSGGTPIPATDTHTIQTNWVWDGTNYQEAGRSDNS